MRLGAGALWAVERCAGGRWGQMEMSSRSGAAEIPLYTSKGWGVTPMGAPPAMVRATR